MAETTPPPALKPADAEAAQEPPPIEPLTRNGYTRLPATQRQIELGSNLDPATLVKHARERDKTQPEFLSVEALVYFIRRADRANDLKTREALFRELLERCTPFFRGKFRGFSKEDREDLQGDVLKKVVEDVLAQDDSGDFMQVRFEVPGAENDRRLQEDVQSR